MKMRQLLLPSITRLTWICSLLFLSNNALALSDFVKNQSYEQITTGLYILMASVILLLAIAASQLFLARRHKGKLVQAQEHFQQSIDTLPTGIVHLGASGKIVYVNKIGATMLGREASKLAHRPFKESFADVDAERLADAVKNNKGSLSARAKSSNFDIAIQFGKKFTEEGVSYQVLTLHNQSSLQRDLHKSNEQKTYFSRLIAKSGLGQVHLNTDSNIYVHDRVFDSFLNPNEMESDKQFSDEAPISEFVSKIHNHDMAEWSQAMTDAGKNGTAKVSVRLLLSSSTPSNSIFRLFEIDIIANSPIPTPKPNEPSKNHFAVFTLLVRADRGLEVQKRKVDILNHQREALLNASPNAIYAIDHNGLLLWSNSRFDDLLRRIAPDAKSKNLLEINPFPENIMKLHKNATFMSTHRDGRSFEIPARDGSAIHLKVELGFYMIHDRLNSKQTVGTIGVVQEISESVKTLNALIKEKVKRESAEQQLVSEQTRLIQLNSDFERAQEQISQQQGKLASTEEALQQANRAVELEKQRMANLLELAPVAIASINQDDQIVHANKVMLERLKYSEKELKKGNIYKLFSEPAEAGTTAKQLNKKGRLQDFHVRLKGKDGKLYPGELKVDLFNEDSKEYLFWIVDRSDEQFQRDKFESLLQYNHAAIAILSDTGFSKLNQAACDLFKVEDEEDVFGKAPFSAEFNTSEERANALAQTVEKVKVNAKPSSFQWKHQIRNKAVQCKLTLVPIFKDHAFDSILCIWAPLTSDLDIEDEHKAASDLGRALQENTNEASIIEQALSKRNIAKPKSTPQKMATDSKESKATPLWPIAQTPTVIEPKAEATHADIEGLPVPREPKVWFNLEAYLKHNTAKGPLPEVLSGIMYKIQQCITNTERALNSENAEAINSIASELVALSKAIQSEPLTQLIQNIEDDCANSMTDNVSIRWPATKNGLQRTLRVIYSHLSEVTQLTE